MQGKCETRGQKKESKREREGKSHRADAGNRFMTCLGTRAFSQIAFTAALLQLSFGTQPSNGVVWVVGLLGRADHGRGFGGRAMVVVVIKNTRV